MIELFSLPSHCIHVSRLPRPIASIKNTKYSMIYHLQKAQEKIRYYSSTFYCHFFPNATATTLLASGRINLGKNGSV